jgi:hypothetical protein
MSTHAPSEKTRHHRFLRSPNAHAHDIRAM